MMQLFFTVRGLDSPLIERLEDIIEMHGEEHDVSSVTPEQAINRDENDIVVHGRFHSAMVQDLCQCYFTYITTDENQLALVRTANIELTSTGEQEPDGISLIVSNLHVLRYLDHIRKLQIGLCQNIVNYQAEALATHNDRISQLEYELYKSSVPILPDFIAATSMALEKIMPGSTKGFPSIKINKH